MISLDEFKRVELRVGEILLAEPIPGSDRLLKLTVDLGGVRRTVVGGLAQSYVPEQLRGLAGGGGGESGARQDQGGRISGDAPGGWLRGGEGRGPSDGQPAGVEWGAGRLTRPSARRNSMKSAEEVRNTVEKRYAEIAKTGSSCCGQDTLAQTGYQKEELEALPAQALMGLGCGNPVRLAELREGEIVLDLGSGGGIDVFLAARQVGPGGRVIGVDMTPEMLVRARANARRLGLENVEFRQGLIEVLPADDASVDVILSNCVINLAPDKTAVFKEAFRVRFSASGGPPEVGLRARLSLAGCFGGSAFQMGYSGNPVQFPHSQEFSRELVDSWPTSWPSHAHHGEPADPAAHRRRGHDRRR